MHIPRSGENLAEGVLWKEESGAYYNRGTIVLPEVGIGTAVDRHISVPTGVPLTLAAYMWCSSFPGPELFFYWAEYDARGGFLGNKTGYSFCASGGQLWEEMVVRMPPRPAEVATIRPKLRYNRIPTGWQCEARVKDLYVGEGWGDEQPPARKKRVPLLDFFPVMIYPSGNRADWTYYRLHGFNIVNQCNRDMPRVVDAGLYGCFTLDGFLGPGTDPSRFGKPDVLRAELEAHDRSGHLDQIKMFHFDCENPSVWFEFKAISAVIREMTPNKPIHVLSPSDGVLRGFNDLADYGSAYVTSVTGERFEGLHRLHNQKLVPGLAQMNSLTTPEHLRNMWNQALTRGAKGACVYADNRPLAGLPLLEETLWISGLKDLSTEAQQTQVPRRLTRMPDNPVFPDVDLASDNGRAFFGNDQDFWFKYNAASTQFELHTSDSDGSDTNATVLVIPDGDREVNFQDTVTKKTGTVGIAFNDCRVHDNLAALLPIAAAADDMGNVPGTVGTTAPSLQGVDFGGASTDEKCTFSVVLPDWYEAGSTIALVANAGMLTTVSDGTATLDVECWVPDYANADGTVSSDLCTTAATTINSTTFADKSFTIDDDVSGHALAAGDLLQFRLSFAGSDTGNAGAGITCVIRKLHLAISA